MGKFKDLTGMRFGRLTVLRRGEDYITPKGSHKIRWWCLCACQLNLPEEERQEVLIRGDQLVSGETKSCGCYNDEIRSLNAIKRLKKYNSYDLESKEYGIGYTSSGEEFWFDLEDYDLIKDYCWSYNKKGYLIAQDIISKKRIRLSRLVMNVLDNHDVEVDHIKHNLFDNRKSKLRLVDNCQNHMNQKLSSNNTSGCKGVGYVKKRNKWSAKITVRKKVISLGYYNDYNDAVKARKEAEEKYFGEFSYDNSMAM